MGEQKPGEIVMVSDADDPRQRKASAMRADFLEICKAHSADADTYGTALVGALAALIYGTARGNRAACQKRVDMVARGLGMCFDVYDKLGGIAEARRRQSSELGHG